MNALYLLQFGCCLATTMMALLLLVSRLHAKHVSRSYEVARWTLFIAMLLFALHYLLQMIHSFRAEGADVGAVVNILFYTPIVALVSYATLRMAGTRTYLRQYAIAAAVSLTLIACCFAAGLIAYRSLHMPHALYAMAACFAASVIYFVVAPLSEVGRMLRKVENETAGDLTTYMTYMRTGVGILFFFTVVMSVSIFYTDSLFITGPLFMAVLYFYIISFVSLGHHTSAINDVLEANFEAEPEAGPEGEQTPLSEEQIREIRERVWLWQKEKGFADSDLTLPAFCRRTGISQQDFTQYLLQTEGLTFRIWLSDIRVEEVKRLLRDGSDYSIDGIAMECGFSSRSWFRQKFKAVTGMTPAEYKDAR